MKEIDSICKFNPDIGTDANELKIVSDLLADRSRYLEIDSACRFKSDIEIDINRLRVVLDLLADCKCGYSNPKFDEDTNGSDRGLDLKNGTSADTDLSDEHWQQIEKMDHIANRDRKTKFTTSKKNMPSERKIFAVILKRIAISGVYIADVSGIVYNRTQKICVCISEHENKFLLINSKYREEYDNFSVENHNFKGYVSCSDIFTISERRIKHRIGTFNNDDMGKIINRIQNSNLLPQSGKSAVLPALENWQSKILKAFSR